VGGENMKKPRRKVTTVYHYTTAHGLLGILEQKKIWATHINYMNDKKEFEDAMDEFRRQTENLAPTDLYKGSSEFLQIMRTMVYVTSFSEDQDNLSQWRAYCPNGAGFSIGFNLAKLKELLKRTSDTSMLKKCIYNPTVKKAEVERIINTGKSTNLRDNFSILVSKMMTLAPYFKDKSFKEENEWRLVFMPGGENLFREGDTLIIPYVEFDLKDENGNLPIENIVIGPTLYPEESHASLQMLLNKYQISASIEKSTIPYRPGL
jgi:hypothetical protein